MESLVKCQPQSSWMEWRALEMKSLSQTVTSAVKDLLPTHVHV